MNAAATTMSPLLGKMSDESMIDLKIPSYIQYIRYDTV